MQTKLDIAGTTSGADDRTLASMGFTYLCACGYFAKRRRPEHDPVRKTVPCTSISILPDTPWPTNAILCVAEGCEYVARDRQHLGSHLYKVHPNVYFRGQLSDVKWWSSRLPIPDHELIRGISRSTVAGRVVNDLWKTQ